MPLTLTDDQVQTVRAQLAQAQQDAEIRKAVEGVWNHKDPALSDEAKALFKKAYPDAQIGDYDLKSALNKRIDDFEKRQADEKKAAQEKERTDFYTTQRAEVQKRHSLTDDAMTRMEKEMDEKKVYDYEVMADSFVSSQPKPIRDTATAHFWHHDRQKEFKEIAADPEGYAYEEILKALNTDEMTRRNR